MSRSPKKIAHDIINAFPCESEPQNLIQLIEEDLIKVESLGEIRAFEIASDIVMSVRDEISYILEKNYQSGMFSTCELVGDNGLTIVGSAFKRRGDTSKELAFRDIMRFQNEILESLCSLSPYDFELFCQKLLEHMGARKALTTKQSGDEGIDFIAQISLPSSFGDIGLGGFEEEFFVNILGQAKRYNNTKKVGTEDIRELVGSSVILRNDELAKADSNIGYFLQTFGKMRLLDPFLCLFMKTSEFSSLAIQLAKRLGVVTKDGRQIATYMAIHRIGFAKSGQTKFYLEDFINWIRN